MRVLLALALFCGLAIPADARSFEELPDTTITADWWKGRIFLPRRGGLRYALKPTRLSDGSLQLCGAVKFMGGSRGQDRAIQRYMVLEIDARQVVRNFLWMPIVTRGVAFEGQQAACRIFPTVAVPDRARFGIVLGRYTFDPDTF
ncbi:MAG: hypothetical protein AAGF13_00310 [Pseudomonadota bacterium]